MGTCWCRAAGRAVVGGVGGGDGGDGGWCGAVVRVQVVPLSRPPPRLLASSPPPPGILPVRTASASAAPSSSHPSLLLLVYERRVLFLCVAPSLFNPSLNRKGSGHHKRWQSTARRRPRSERACHQRKTQTWSRKEAMRCRTGSTHPRGTRRHERVHSSPRMCVSQREGVCRLQTEARI